jgi:anti-anti-sigma factor
MQWAKIIERVRDDVVILDLLGNVTLWGADEVLPGRVSRLLERGYSNILLNLERTPYIDSSGLGGILSARSLVTAQNGTLKLLHVAPKIRGLLHAARILPYFELFDSEDRALASFMPAKAGSPEAEARSLITVVGGA